MLRKDGESAVAVYGRKTDDPKRRTEQWTKGFVIEWPDDHGASTYTVENIDEDSVTLSYKTTFDHRSFGRNQISRDQGTFKLPWLSTEFLRYEGTQPKLTVSLLPSSEATPGDIAQVAETAKHVFNQICAVKTDIWPEPAVITELPGVWHIDFRAKDRLLVVNGQQTTVKPGRADGMTIPLMKPDLTCTLLKDPIAQP